MGQSPDTGRLTPKPAGRDRRCISRVLPLGRADKGHSYVVMVIPPLSSSFSQRLAVSPC